MTDPHGVATAIPFDAKGRIAADIACLNCGYNLRTQPAAGNCPECGRHVSYSTRGYVVRLDAEGRIERDLPCVKCGYNLRTLVATGLCPECGHAIARSTQGERDEPGTGGRHA